MKPFPLLLITFLLTAGACQKTDSDVRSEKVACSQAIRDVNLQFVQHTRALVKILRENQDDCGKLLAGVKAYRTKHTADIAYMQKSFEALQSLPAPEFDACQDDLFERMKGLDEDHETLVLEARKLCEDHRAGLARVLDLMR